jgi:hypothetical protein
MPVSVTELARVMKNAIKTLKQNRGNGIEENPSALTPPTTTKGKKEY